MTETDYVAQLRRALQATEQALSDERIGAQNAEVMAYAAHEFCTKVLDLKQGGHAVMQARDALYAAHDATTPSPMQTHVVIEIAELNRLKAVRCDHLCDWCPPGAEA